MDAPLRPWNPSRGSRILIGVGTIWMPLYLAGFIAFMAFTFFSITKKHANAMIISNLFQVVFPLHCATILISFALMIVYLVHAIRNDRLTQEMRIVWILLIVFVGIIADPVYWWMYLRPRAATPQV